MVRELAEQFDGFDVWSGSKMDNVDNIGRLNRINKTKFQLCMSAFDIHVGKCDWSLTLTLTYASNFHKIKNQLKYLLVL